MKRINNLKELRAEKQRIKQELETKNNEKKSPAALLIPLAAMLTKGKKKKGKKNKKGMLALFNDKPKKNDSPLQNGVKEVLTLAATLAVSRFKMGSFAKVLVTAGVAILTPIIVEKLEKNRDK